MARAGRLAAGPGDPDERLEAVLALADGLREAKRAAEPAAA